MLNKSKHQLIMGQILRDIYQDAEISSCLGFKGGTAAYFFYQLPRFSVDLDFDLLNDDESKQKKIFEKLQIILQKYGIIKDLYIKRYTIFALLSYGSDDHNIKIEISYRKLDFSLSEQYEILEYLGIPILVGKPDYLFASKLAALTLRKEPAMRDLYDIHYFAKNNWDIQSKIIRYWTQKNLVDYLQDCISFIEKINNNQILQGLGEVIETQQEKQWIKKSLKSELIFLLKNYIFALSR